MARQTQEYLVFVASPGDLADARDAVGRAADGAAQAVGRKFGMSLNVQGWEQVQPTLGRPQGAINPLVDQCDVFVGLLNRRWGSPTGTHSSGFEEEFERILARQGETVPPHVALFFASVPSDLVADAGPELSKVLEFERRIRDEHTALYRPFNDVGDLERALQLFFSAFLSDRVDSRISPPEGATSPLGTQAAGTPESDHVDEARSQVGGSLSAWADVVLGRDPAEPPDRDRLLAFALGLNQDHELLPTHVANRLYRRREDLVLSRAEGDLWLSTLCSDVERSSATGWDRVIPGVYFFPSPYRDSELVKLASDESARGRRGALRLLEDLGSRPPELWQLPQSEPAGEPASGSDDEAEEPSLPARWLALFADEATQQAAAAYLYKAATKDDELLLEALAEGIRGDQALLEPYAAIEAVRGDLSPAIAIVVEQAYNLPDWLVGAIGANIDSVSSADLLALITGRHSKDQLRLSAFDRLVEQGVDDVQGLLVANALLRGSEATRSHLLSLPESAAAVARDWIFKAWNESSADDRRKFDIDEEVMAATVEHTDLAQRLTMDLAGLATWEALSHQTSHDLAEQARDVLRNEGESFAADLRDAYPTREQGQSVGNFVAARARIAALRILGSLPVDLRQPGDADMARSELKRRNTHTTKQAIWTLAAIGESSDFPALVDGIKGSYAYGAERRGLVVAAATLAEGKHIESLIDDDDETTASAATELLLERAESTTADLVKLLYHRHVGVRMRVLKALLERLSKDELEQLLIDYPKHSGTHWYNVIAALDWHLFRERSVDPIKE